MRRFRAALIALLLALASLLVAGPASAGGPTSVLLVVPGTGSTASLYATDAEYAAIAGHVGASEADGIAGRIDRSGAGHEAGPGVTVTWLIHDMQVWRVDRIYAGAPGGPWVSTQVVVDGTDSIWDSPVVWHTAADGPELTVLLDRLGLGAGAGAGAAVGEAPGSGTVAREATPELGSAGQPRRDGAAATSSGWPAWSWGVAGLALGAALTLAAARAVRRRADLAADEAPPWPVTDELSSAAPRR